MYEEALLNSKQPVCVSGGAQGADCYHKFIQVINQNRNGKLLFKYCFVFL
jgi:hypothetical protein